MKENVRDQLSKRLRLAAMAIVASGTVAATTVHAIPPSDMVLVPPTEPRLANFDVTDPAHIKGESSVRLDAPGPIGFVSPLEIRTQLVRFRQDHEDAVLDLPRVKAPNLEAVQWLALQGPITHLGNDIFTVAHRAAEAAPARNYRVVDAQGLNRVFDVKQVREETPWRPALDSLYLMIPPN